MILLTSSSIFLNLVQLTSSLIVLNWVTPSEYGVWQSLIIIQSFSLIIQFGVINGLSRELPYLIGKNEYDKAKRMAGNAQAVTFMGGGGFVIFALISVLLVKEVYYCYTIFVVLMVSGLELIKSYLHTTFRSNQSFSLLGKIYLLEGFLGLISLPLVYYYGYLGLLLRILLIASLMTILTFFLRPFRVQLTLDRKSIKCLMKTGIPIFFIGYLLNISNTFPKLILLKLGGAELVGLIAPALALLSVSAMLPSAASQYIYPKMSLIYGYSNDPKSIWPMIWKSSVVIVLVSLPFYLIGLYVIEKIMINYLSQYAKSVLAIKWCLFAGLFLGPRSAINGLFVLKSWRLISIYTVSVLISQLFFPLIFAISFNDHVEGVAVGIFISSIFTLIILSLITYKAIHLAEQ